MSEWLLIYLPLAGLLHHAPEGLEALLDQHLFPPPILCRSLHHGLLHRCHGRRRKSRRQGLEGAAFTDFVYRLHHRAAFGADALPRFSGDPIRDIQLHRSLPLVWFLHCPMQRLGPHMPRAFAQSDLVWKLRMDTPVYVALQLEIQLIQQVIFGSEVGEQRAFGQARAFGDPRGRCAYACLCNLPHRRP